MCNINYAEIKFDHIVVFKPEDTAFACCRENGSGKTRLFLIFGKESGHVYTRNGLVSSWEILGDNEATLVRQLTAQATQDGIAVYQFNGSSKTVAGHDISHNN